MRNIAQTLQFIESGAADAGIIALSLALAPPMRALKPSLAAWDFRSFPMDAAGHGILKEYGFARAGE